jgi:hypothetical protein
MDAQTADSMTAADGFDDRRLTAASQVDIPTSLCE